ncbi:DUF4331 domain-containing protein [Spongisporangium articulatum]|uniref:DUF4331 domain-containing protein n=1 Tax=Spongisporangium articulatum TaxID=3362603 RepID=A0ABW8APY2_9ACTN
MVCAVSTALLTAVGGVGSAQASSHREAPLTSGDPRIDNTDVYAFVAPDATDSVTLIANWIPFEEPNGGPNFYPFQDGAWYDIRIDNNGDAKPDIIYRWVFKSVDKRGTSTFLANNGPVTSLDDENLLYKQTWTLTKITTGTKVTYKEIGHGTAAPSFAGEKSIPSYADLRDEAVTSITGGGKTYAGQADDPFFLDLRVFDLLYGGDLSETGTDTLKGYNVNTIALQVPKSEVSLKGDATKNPVIGIWSTTSKRPMNLATGKVVPKTSNVQVSRLGNPLVNEVVMPAGLKNAFNSVKPVADAGIAPVVKAVTNPELPGLLKAIYNIDAPPTPRNDLVEIYLTGIAKKAPTLDGSTAPIQADLNSQVLNGDVKASSFRPAEELRLNTSIAPAGSPNRLGVIGGDFQGFPNGRRLTDDVIDISLQAVEGAAASGHLVSALAEGDGVDANDNPFDSSFPYVALPNTTAVNSAASVLPLGAPNGRGGDGPAAWRAPVADGLLATTMALALVGGLTLVRRRRRGVLA